jgi:hypothetical protein
VRLVVDDGIAVDVALAGGVAPPRQIEILGGDLAAVPLGVEGLDVTAPKRPMVSCCVPKALKSAAAL